MTTFFIQEHFELSLNLICFANSHGLRTPGQKIAFSARPKIHSHSQIFRYGGRTFCLPHRPEFSGFFDFSLHWVSIVRANSYFFHSLRYIMWSNSKVALLFYQIESWMNGISILLSKLFWPTARKKFSSDREKLLRSLEQFIQSVKGQKNFW